MDKLEKTAQVIQYFSGRSPGIREDSFFCLLFLLDSSHFNQAGRTATGLEYVARAKGPVPTILEGGFLHLPESLSELLRASEFGVCKDEKKLFFSFTRAFSENQFSRRELRIMESLSNDVNLYGERAIQERAMGLDSPWSRAELNKIMDWKLSLDGSGISEEEADEVKKDQEFFEVAFGAQD